MTIDPVWDPETARLIGLFYLTAPHTEPFELRPGIRVIDLVKFYSTLADDIAAGPGSARALYGAVQHDLRDLLKGDV